MRRAAELLAENDFAAAIPHLEAALEEDPGNTNARFNLAYAYQSAGDDEGAIRHYRLVTAEEPELAAARQNLAALLMRTGQLAEAATEYEALHRALPDDSRILLLLAASSRGSGSSERAVQAYQQALALDGETLAALTGLAETLAELGRTPEAASYYLKAAEIDSAAEQALLGVAAKLEEEGETDQALAVYRRYARSHPQDAAVQERIGLLLLEGGGTAEEAARFLERSVSLEPQPVRHAALAEAYRRQSRDEAAREQLRLAAEADPADADFRFRHASALIRAGDHEAAAREYLGALETDPSHAGAWSGLAFAMFKTDNFPACLKALHHAEALGDLRPASAYLKALALDKLQLYEEALAAYQAFLALPSNLEDEKWKAQQRLKTIERVLRKR